MADKKKKKVPRVTSYLGGRKFKGPLPPEFMPKGSEQPTPEPAEKNPQKEAEKGSSGKPSKP